jgi:hypothetical protein
LYTVQRLGLLSMNRLNQTEPATLNFAVLGFLQGFLFYLFWNNVYCTEVSEVKREIFRYVTHKW